MKNNNTLYRLLLEPFALLCALLFFLPIFFLIMNSVKTFQEIIINTAGFPTQFEYQNYIRAWNRVQFPRAFFNSLRVTVFSTLGIIGIASTSAFWIARYGRKLEKTLFFLFIGAMIIPFQAVMIPLVQVIARLGLINTIFGVVLCFWGFGFPLGMFMVHGFLKSIPNDIEEAAIVDGANIFQVFVLVVIPLLQTILITICVLQALWIWNEFLMPHLILSHHSLETIPVAINRLFDQQTRQWDLALPVLVMSIIPVVIFFLFMQRHIIKGIVEGAVKG